MFEQLTNPEKLNENRFVLKQYEWVHVLAFSSLYSEGRVISNSISFISVIYCLQSKYLLGGKELHGKTDKF